MKKTSTGSSRSKPPPVRSYLNRSQPVDRSPFHSPTHHKTDRLVIMSENTDLVENVDSIQALHGSSAEVKECMKNWLTFMQMLKGVCTSGAQLSRSLGALVGQSSASKQRAMQCQLMWDQLNRSTAAASALVKNQTIAALQEVHLSNDIDADQIDINQQVVCSGLMTMINLQYQLSIAYCENLAELAECQCYPPHSEPDWEAVTRCFLTRLPVPAQPLGRRWSEIVSGEKKTDESSLRRWSMPWKLVLPSSGSTNERRRSRTPETVWRSKLANQEQLENVIALLSAQPESRETSPLPGFVLTKASDVQGGGGYSRPETPPKINLTPRPSWYSGADDVDLSSLVSRKSSSSTDSSSCYSIHSHTEEAAHSGQRTHLYSMWSGNDKPFLKLPESSENSE